MLPGVEKYQHFIRNIGGATNLLYAKLVQLEAVEKKLSMNEQEIFKRITVHIKSNERQRAEIAASELANMKMHKKKREKGGFYTLLKNPTLLPAAIAATTEPTATAAIIAVTGNSGTTLVPVTATSCSLCP